MTPGLYDDIKAEDYHAGKFDEDGPTFSASAAKTLINESPLHCHASHPKLGGTAREPTASMDFGQVAHSILLGKGNSIAVLAFDDWRTKAAKEAREAARAANQVPVLESAYDRANEMATAVRSQLDAMGLERALKPGRNEVTAFWTQMGVKCRAQIDNLRIEDADIFDLKTIGSAHPDACIRAIGNNGYDIQEAAYKAAIGILIPELNGRLTFTFIFCETNPPFAVTPIQLSGEWSCIGISKWHRALTTWKTCLDSGTWPSYSTEIFRAEPKPWMLPAEMGEEALR